MPAPKKVPLQPLKRIRDQGLDARGSIFVDVPVSKALNLVPGEFKISELQNHTGRAIVTNCRLIWHTWADAAHNITVGIEAIRELQVKGREGKVILANMNAAAARIQIAYRRRLLNGHSTIMCAKNEKGRAKTLQSRKQHRKLTIIAKTTAQDVELDGSLSVVHLLTLIPAVQSALRKSEAAWSVLVKVRLHFSPNEQLLGSVDGVSNVNLTAINVGHRKTDAQTKLLHVSGTLTWTAVRFTWVAANDDEHAVSIPYASIVAIELYDTALDGSHERHVGKGRGYPTLAVVADTIRLGRVRLGFQALNEAILEECLHGIVTAIQTYATAPDLGVHWSPWGSGLLSKSEVLSKGTDRSWVALGAGRYYSGSLKARKPHGVGVEISPNGQYTGYFESGKYHGHGKLVCPNGTTYTGGWITGLREGQGKEVFASGLKYSGNWRAGQRHGSGRATTADGGEYDGNWEFGKRHGRGVRRYVDGSMYDGEFMAGRKHGLGMAINLVKGTVYSGEYAHGVMHGKGRLIWSESGDVYSGTFERGKQHGNGIFTSAAGITQKGQWIMGKLSKNNYDGGTAFLADKTASALITSVFNDVIAQFKQSAPKMSDSDSEDGLETIV